MACGPRQLLVALSNCPEGEPVTGSFFTDLSPAKVWASVQPHPPQNDGRSVWHLVTMRYHPQVTMDTRIVLVNKTRTMVNGDVKPRELFVKGVQNVDEMNKQLKLLCEEVLP